MFATRETLARSNWDRWLPLATVALFVVFGAIAVAADLGVGIPEGDVERFHILYTEIGIQTTAGIFAIIISLSLVAIQFAAQEYSHRIMEYYIRSTVFWTTMAVYLAVIVAGIVFQARATEADDNRIALGLLLGVLLCLSLLVPHFLITAAYLKPEFIVRKLMERLNDGYARSVAAGGLPKDAEDRLLPVVEIIERSIDKGDLTTVRGAVDEVVAAHSRWVSLGVGNADGYFLRALQRVARKSISQPDEQQAAVSAIAAIAEVGGDRGPDEVISLLEEPGFAALRRDSEVVVGRVIRAIAEVSEASNDAAVEEHALSTFAELSHRLVTADQRGLLLQLADVVTTKGSQASDRGESARFHLAIELLEEMGHDTATSALSEVVKRVVAGLQHLGEAAPAPTKQAIDMALLRIERNVPRSERALLAAIAFARSRVAPASPQDSPPAQDKPNAGDDPLGLADLWNEPKA